jgi:regulation of enolase protein 1 (concanavalin A-like superfamily)
VQKAVICTEKKDDENLRLCVNVFNKEGGDRSMRDVGAALAQIFYRVLYRAGSCKIQYSFSGERYTDLREFHVDPAIGITDVCLYACSPGDSYCDCTFFDFNMMEDRRSEEIENDEC